MPQQRARSVASFDGIGRALARLFGGGPPDPLETRLAQAGAAGTPPTPEEAADFAAARAEIRRGESTTDPLGPQR